MSAHLFLSPHHDDETLFASMTLLRLKPDVIFCTTPKVQERYGITADQRLAEAVAAMDVLGIENYRTWPYPDDTDATDSMVIDLTCWLDTYAFVWAPMWEHDGHFGHNAVNQAAVKVFGDRCRFYATYRRGSARTRTEHEVFPEPDWPARKLRAMACYESQVNLPNTRAWFDDWSREWVAQ